jgi:exodeoxyribonuclease-5
MTMTTTVDLDREQKYVLDGLRADMRRQMLLALDGVAGSGKTTILTQLAAERPDYAVAAMTGRAVAVLQERGIERAQTLHSLIYYPVLDPRGRLVRYQRRRKLPDGIRGLMLDEALMVGSEVFSDARSYNLPILLSGGRNQLLPVKDNRLRLLDQARYRLSTPHRNAGAICHFSNYLLQGGRPQDFKDPTGAVQVLGHNDHLPDVDAADVAITAFNDSRCEYNRQAREILGRFGDEPEAGDLVICLRNAKKLNLFNGSIATVLAVDLDRDRFDLLLSDNRVVEGVSFDYRYFNFPDHHELEVDPDRLGFDYAYALSCHKAAGDEWDRVVVIEQRCQHWPHENWVYTASSRAKKTLYWMPCR